MMRREACVVAGGKWQGHRILVKNRDRAYNPTIRVVHTVLDDVEVMYLEDKNSGWLEGLNQFGIGIVNSALAVQQDEAEGVSRVDKGDKKGPVMSEDRHAIFVALKCRNLRDAIKALRTVHLGSRGHTLVGTKDKIISLERVDGQESKKVLDDRRPHVRTNHGLKYPEAGYQEGEDLVSSLTRRQEALAALHEAKTLAQVAPSLWNRRDKKFNPVRLDGKVYTTTQMVLDLTGLEMWLYCLPDKVEFLGVCTDLPEGYKPKLSFRLYRYPSLESDKPSRVMNVPQCQDPVDPPSLEDEEDVDPPDASNGLDLNRIAFRVACMAYRR